MFPGKKRAVEKVAVKKEKGCDNLDAKTYLQQLEDMNAEINQKQEEIKDLKIVAESFGYMHDGEIVLSSKEGDKIPKIVAKYIDLETEVNEEIERYVDLKNKITIEIRGLKKKLHINILFKRYVEFKELKEIAFETKYAYGYIKNQHKYALHAFERKYEKNLRKIVIFEKSCDQM